MSGGNLVGYTGGTATTLADSTGLLSTNTNYDITTTGDGTRGVSLAFNTLRFATTASTLGFSGSGNIGAGNGVMNAGSGLFTISGATFTIGTKKELVLNAANADLAISSVIQNNVGGTSAVTKTGTGTVNFSGNNTYSGITTINQGLFNVSHANALGTTAGNTVVSSGATLELGLATGSTLAEPLNLSGTGVDGLGVAHLGGGKTITLSGPVTLGSDATIRQDGGTTLNQGVVVLGTNCLTVQNDGGANCNVNTTITGTGGRVTKTGDGTLTLTASSSYTGETIIRQGTLALGASASLASTRSITVSNGAVFNVSALAAGFSLATTQTLRGNGTVNGAVTVKAGGTLAPGASIGTLTVGALTNQGNILIEVDKTQAPSNDVVNVTGALKYGGTLTVTNIGSAALALGDSFRVFPAGGTGSLTVTGLAGPGLALAFSDGLVSVVTASKPQLQAALVSGGTALQFN